MFFNLHLSNFTVASTTQHTSNGCSSSTSASMLPRSLSALKTPPHSMNALASSASLHAFKQQRHTLICAAAAEESATPETTAPLDSKPQAVTPAWQTAVDYLQSGETFTTTITNVNKSGVLVAVGKLNGFIPYKLMNRKLLSTIDKSEWSKVLIGQQIDVKVTQVVVPERRLICSQKAAMLEKSAKLLKLGDIVSGTVTSLHSFGAFVELSEPETVAGTEVILPLREVCWDWIATVNERLVKGERLTVAVQEVRSMPAKVVVSLKRMQDDPLKETLDKVLPLEGGAGYADIGVVPTTVPAGVEDILNELSKEEGITEVTLGRRVEEKRTVSQDLELWMSREVVTDGFNLVARAGRIVQEIHVSTSMDTEAMKSAVQRVLKRVS